jgi:hypothetical protein
MAVSELANCLPVAPQWSSQVGEARRDSKGNPLAGVYRDSYCTFNIAESEDGEVAEHILCALESLAPKHEFIRTVSKTGGSAAFYIFWYSNGDTGEVFEGRALVCPGLDFSKRSAVAIVKRRLVMTVAIVILSRKSTWCSPSPARDQPPEAGPGRMLVHGWPVG